MEAHDRSFSFLSKPSFYDIPFFQRAYVWNMDNWSELFNDLTKENHSHFLGSIILKNQMAVSGDTPRYDVIDGQQRLTTLSVLLRATYDNIVEFYSDRYDKDTLSDCEKSMMSILFVFEGGIKKTKHIKIKHSHLDRKAYESVLAGDFSKKEQWESYTPSAAPEHTNSIIKAYSFFREALMSISENTLNQLWNLLTEDRIKFLVNIDLGASDNEQAIFDTVNSSGVRLTSADTIKNSLFQRYVDYLRSEHDSDIETKAIELYTNTWKAAFLDSEETDEYWGELRQYGRLKRSNLETLLYSFAVIKGFFNPSDDNMSDLPQKYKSQVEHYGDEELKTFLEELRDYANIYREYFDTDMILIGFSDLPKRIMCVFSALEIATFYPYLLQQMYMYDKGQISKGTLDQNLFCLERYVVINAICRGSNKNYNNECKMLIDQKKNANELFYDCVSINDENFEWGIRRLTTNKLPTLLLFCVELYRLSLENYDIKQLKYEYTLEHIMPKKWEKNWSDVIAFDEDNNPMDPSQKDEIYSVRSQAIYEIGNMTLLNSKLNTSISNGSFSDKKEGKNGKSGLKDLAGLTITKEILDIPEWNELTIRSRTSELSKTIREIWNAESLNVPAMSRYSDFPDTGNEYYLISGRGSKGVFACGFSSDHSSFTVYKGSNISDEVAGIFQDQYKNAYNLREKLISTGVISDYVFNEDYAFASVSLAASVILGRNATGKGEWKTKSGIPYRENAIEH